MVGSFRAAGETENKKIFDFIDCSSLRNRPLCHLVHFPEFFAMGLNISVCLCRFLPVYLFTFVLVASIQASPCLNLFYEMFSEALWPFCPSLHFFIPKL